MLECNMLKQSVPCDPDALCTIFYTTLYQDSVSSESEEVQSVRPASLLNLNVAGVKSWQLDSPVNRIRYYHNLPVFEHKATTYARWCRPKFLCFNTNNRYPTISAWSLMICLRTWVYLMANYHTALWSSALFGKRDLLLPLSDNPSVLVGWGFVWKWLSTTTNMQL